MRELSVRRLPPVVILAMMILLGAGTANAQTDYPSFDIRKARDVAVSAAGTLWTIGPEATPNATIQRLVGSALVTQPGSAVRIAVDPSGTAWVVNSGGELYHWEKNGTAPETWVLSNLKAMDVGVGANGAVWAVGTDHRIMGFKNGTSSGIRGRGSSTRSGRHRRTSASRCTERRSTRNGITSATESLEPDAQIPVAIQPL